MKHQMRVMPLERSDVKKLMLSLVTRPIRLMILSQGAGTWPNIPLNDPFEIGMTIGKWWYEYKSGDCTFHLTGQMDDLLLLKMQEEMRLFGEIKQWISS